MVWFADSTSVTADNFYATADGAIIYGWRTDSSKITADSTLATADGYVGAFFANSAFVLAIGAQNSALAKNFANSSIAVVPLLSDSVIGTNTSNFKTKLNISFQNQILQFNPNYYAADPDPNYETAVDDPLSFYVQAPYKSFLT